MSNLVWEQLPSGEWTWLKPEEPEPVEPRVSMAEKLLTYQAAQYIADARVEGSSFADLKAFARRLGYLRYLELNRKIDTRPGA